MKYLASYNFTNFFFKMAMRSWRHEKVPAFGDLGHPGNTGILIMELDKEKACTMKRYGTKDLHCYLSDIIQNIDNMSKGQIKLKQFTSDIVGLPPIFKDKSTISSSLPPSNSNTSAAHIFPNRGTNNAAGSGGGDSWGGKTKTRRASIMVTASGDAISSSGFLSSVTRINPSGDAGSVSSGSSVAVQQSVVVNKARRYAAQLLKLSDLRRMDPSLNGNQEEAIVTRRHCLLFMVDPVRAILLHDRVLFIVPDGADSLLTIIQQYIFAWNGAKNRDRDSEDTEEGPASFEQHTMEAIMTIARSLASQQYTQLQQLVKRNLANFKTSIVVPISILESLRILKHEIEEVGMRISACVDTLNQITGSDEAMSLMNLSLLRKRPHLYLYPLSSDLLDRHNSIEDILSSDLMDFTTLNNQLQRLRKEISNAEDLLRIRLDTLENQLLVVDTCLVIVMNVICFGVFLTGAGAMNLKNPLTDRKYSFTGTVFFTIGVAILGYLSIFYYLRHTNIIPLRAKELISYSTSSNRMFLYNMD